MLFIRSAILLAAMLTTPLICIAQCSTTSCDCLSEFGGLDGGCSDGMWFQADLLGWSIKDNDIPPLVTTSPQGVARADAGVLGQNTSVLIGGEIDDGYRSGVGLRGGIWLDRCHDRGLEFGYFSLFDESNQLTASTATPIGDGDGLPILARPFFNVQTGLEDAELVSYPGVVDGSVSVRSTSSLDTAEVIYRRSGYRRCNWRMDLLGGYRYFRFDESLRISEDLVITEVGGVFVPGTTIGLVDSFATDNTFHGGQLGVSAEYWRDLFSLELRAKVALGNVSRKTRINGGTLVSVPGGGTNQSTGGLLALPTNIGSYSGDSFAALPELGANLKLRLTCNAHLTVGYTLLLLNDVARTGGEIDRNVNPGFIPGGVVVVPDQSPAFQADKSDFWVQGLNLGLVIAI